MENMENYDVYGEFLAWYANSDYINKDEPKDFSVCDLCANCKVKKLYDGACWTSITGTGYDDKGNTIVVACKAYK